VLKLLTASVLAFLAAAEDLNAALNSNDECNSDGCAVNALQHRAMQTDEEDVENFQPIEGEEAVDFLELSTDAEYEGVEAIEYLQQLVAANTSEVQLLEDSVEACSGGGSLPHSGCYGGNFLTEIFFVKVNGHGSSGTVSMWAKGPKSGKCLGRSYSQHGTSVSIQGVESCGLTGLQYNVNYCSNQDQVHVNIVKPMAANVVLNRKSCR